MTLTGIIRGDTIQLDEKPPLPEGARVEVELHSVRSGQLTPDERVELVRRTQGTLRAQPDQVRAALEEDYYGVE